MQKILLLTILIVTSNFVSAQKENFANYLKKIEAEADYRKRVDLLSRQTFVMSNPDSTFVLAQRGLKLAQSIGYKKGEIKSQSALAWSAWVLGDFATAIKMGFSVLEYANSIKDTSLIAKTYGIITNSYRDQGDYNEALQLLFQVNDIIYATKYDRAIFYAAIGSNYYGLEKYDSALYYLNKSSEFTERPFGTWTALIAGRTMEKLNNDSVAYVYYKKSIRSLKQSGNLKDLAGAYNSLALLYKKKNQTDSVIFYANQALKISQQKNFSKEKSETYLILSNAYEKVEVNKAFDYYKLAMSAKDSLFNQEKQRQITSFKFNEELRKNEIETKEQQFKNRNRTNALMGLSGSFLVFIILLFRNNRNKQKAKSKIENAYEKLKSTQSQLIQSEKMASLGELTAGIAHEIQNPLNFVNNFSEVSNELIDEMSEELDNGDIAEAKIIGSDIKQNLEKINHHGKRAETIVKGMLQHSRVNSGEKELTDINALADEYLRLSYHGLRAKDKSFNADFKTEFDESLPKINVVPQDIGRVLLNLINNAFYAVDKRAKENIEGYKPIVTVSTFYENSQAKISVNDNGSGIPDKIKDKIFQPFFTTKPTGSGTGLGLSLSYDIIKAHGGELRVETKEGEGSEFIIQIPYINS